MSQHLSKIKWPIAPNNDWDTMVQQVPELQPLVDAYLHDQKLDSIIQKRIPTLYWPMAAWLAEQHQGTPLFIGINGAQGSGKSTLTGLLSLLLSHAFNKRVLDLSIDDLYLDKASRLQLAKEVHPLFITRGVPGTHDVQKGLDIFNRIRAMTAGDTIEVPRFDKSIDDQLPQKQWQHIQQPIDIVLFEGWCVGANPQPPDDLHTAANELETSEDPQGIWRQAVNDTLSGEYQGWFSQLDLLIMLKVPSMEQVYEWRGLQEHKLSQKSDDSQNAIMDQQALKRFIMHYERLTRHQLKEMPARADVVLSLDTHHQIADIVIHET